MSTFDICSLNEFYAQICVQDGMHISEFQMKLRELFERSRLACDLNDYRLSRLPWKKLADEVTPVSRFLRFQGVESGRIRFPLDNDPPDCWLWKEGESDPIGIEVTIALGTERYHLAKELVVIGQGRGFVGVSDDAPRQEFDRVMSEHRVMYSTDQALSAIGGGILRCLSRKNEPKFAGFDLLIQAPLLSLPQERWETIAGELCAAATTLPFREIHVVSNADETPWGFQIK